MTVFLEAAVFLVLAAVFLGTTELLIAAPTLRTIVPVDVPDDPDTLLAALTVRGCGALVGRGGALIVLLFALDRIEEAFVDLLTTIFAKPAVAATAADLNGETVGLSGEIGRGTGLAGVPRC